MLGLRLKAAPLGLVWMTGLAGVWFSASCSDKPASDLGWGVSFACESDRLAADQLRLIVHKQDCSGAALYDHSLAKGAEAPAAGAVGPGKYGLEAIAQKDGVTLAQGCIVATLPARETPQIQLVSEACAESQRDAGADDLDATVSDEASTEVDSGDMSDAGDTDDGDVDGGGDAEPPPPMCPPDCSDPDPCTDDRCENGLCVHTPVTAPRECDGVPCTVGDQCMSGACTAGTAHDELCVTDTDPCTSETCHVGTGCNRTTAEGASCNDNIACTASDSCSAGICRGSDGCMSGPGGVCSAVSGQCVSTGCTSAADCSDGNPCTNDVCTNGICNRSPNTGATCDDGKSCTSPDACANGSCVGTSTCPSTATCTGSTCVCPAGTTLCGNACVDLTTSVPNCGICNRACAATGQSCQNSACKPTATNASKCTARRYGGHDYLFCDDTQSWDTARGLCRGWGFGLVIINNQAENDFVQTNAGTANRWLAANDRGNDGGNCTKVSGTVGEGNWYWASATSNKDDQTALCALASTSATTCSLATGAYQNWRTGEPNNTGCACPLFVCVPGLGEDCASLIAATGTWDDKNCGATSLGYVCESP